MAGSRSILLMVILYKNIVKLNRQILAKINHAPKTFTALLVCTFNP